MSAILGHYLPRGERRPADLADGGKSGTPAPAVPRYWSLRRRLLLMAVGSMLAAWLIGAVAMYWSAARQNERLHDDRLVELARTVMAFADHELDEMGGDASNGLNVRVDQETSGALQDRYRYQIWSTTGKLLLRSANAPATPLGRATKSGFDHDFIDGREACVYVLKAPSGAYEIHVADMEDQRSAALAESLTGPLVAFCMAIVVMVGLIGGLMTRVLHPLSDTANQLVHRRPTELEPIQVASMPLEMRPMIDAINGLFGRIQAAMARERDFSAVTAHELRTPLAALRLHAQIALRADDPEIRKEALNGLKGSVDRCAHFVDQLLAMARVEGDPQDAPHEVVKIDQLISEVICDLALEAKRRDVRLQPSVNVELMRGRRFGIQTLLRNLVGNAIRHVPAGGRVEITAHADADFVTLCVDDAGCGIPPEKRAIVFDRFRRLRDDGSGIGLGLAIVRRVADAHGASIELGDSHLGGLRVEVRFPVAFSARA
jgi:two-component system OmpR family sensor kinase/two-component system sensor histidine kinase QseC